MNSSQRRDFDFEFTLYSTGANRVVDELCKGLRKIAFRQINYMPFAFLAEARMFCE